MPKELNSLLKETLAASGLLGSIHITKEMKDLDIYQLMNVSLKCGTYIHK